MKRKLKQESPQTNKDFIKREETILQQYESKIMKILTNCYDWRFYETMDVIFYLIFLCETMERKDRNRTDTWNMDMNEENKMDW